MTPDPTLRDRVLDAAAAQPAPTRSSARLWAVVTYVLALIGAVVSFLGAGGFSHSAGRPWPLTVGIAAGALVLAIVVGALGWWRGRSMVGRPAALLAVVVAMAPIATFAWLVSWHGRYVEPFARVGWRCLGLTLATGALPAAAALWLRRRTVPVHPGLNGAVLGTVGGALGGVLVDFWCPLTNAPHVLIGHVAPVLLLAAIGCLVGQAVLPVRRR